MNITDKKVLGIPVVVVVVAALATTGVASAALLNVYTTSEGTVNVEQSVVFGDDSVEKSYEVTEVAGDSMMKCYTIKNRSSESSAPIKLVTKQNGGNVVGIKTSYFDYSKKTFPLVVGGDEGSSDFGELYATANPKCNGTVVYKAELPSDYFQTDPANINFQISLTDSNSENNFQITFYPEKSEDWNWRFLSPSVDKIEKVYGKSDVETLPEIVSVKFINNSNEPNIVKVVTSKPKANQSFGVQATDGGEGYKAIITEGFTFANKDTSGHKDVATQISGPVLEPGEAMKVGIFNEFDVALEPGTYEITHQVIPN